MSHQRLSSLESVPSDHESHPPQDYDNIVRGSTYEIESQLKTSQRIDMSLLVSIFAPTNYRKERRNALLSEFPTNKTKEYRGRMNYALT